MSSTTPCATQAVVFDCDGLLLDTEPLWGIAERAFVEELGGIWHEELRDYTHGRSVAGSAALLAEAARAALDPAEAEHQLVTHFEKVVARQEAPLMPGARALVEALHGTPLAVASNSPTSLLEALLTRAGVRHHFLAVIGAGGPLAPKPEPDVYLAACAALRVDPSRAHALEDSQPGADAALTAGLTVTGVNETPKVRLHGCHQVPSLASLTPRDLGTAEPPGV